MSETSGFVFNIGFNRAGTTSLVEALNYLQIPSLHHKYQGIRLFDLIQQNMRLGQRLFYGMDQGYQGFSDFAGQHFFALLDKQYPGSKFILTIRSLETWLESRERKVLRNRANPDYRYHFLKIDREAWTKEYMACLQDVRDHFKGRNEDLLIIDIPSGDGWEKLCPFLNKSVPGLPFPRKNVSRS